MSTVQPDTKEKYECISCKYEFLYEGRSKSFYPGYFPVHIWVENVRKGVLLVFLNKMSSACSLVDLVYSECSWLDSYD